MILTDLHTHTLFCDGNCTPRELVLSAVNKGFETIGIGHHGYTDFDTSYCIKKERVGEFIAEVNELKREFAGIINVLAGVEQDYYAGYCDEAFDYVIGSVHYVYKNGTYYPVDLSADDLLFAVNDGFGGDFYALAEEYFRTVSEVGEKTHADIIGHFDLVSKFNEGNMMFDDTSPRYREAWRRAADRLIGYGAPFEINTGAISRGYRTEAYPSGEMIAYIASHGGRFILSSDSHNSGTIGFGFDEYEKYVK